MYREHHRGPIGLEYVRHGQSPLRKSPARLPLTAGSSMTALPPRPNYNIQEQPRTSLDDRYTDIVRKWRYHESRLATEVALLKYNTPYEKREHSTSSHNLREKSTKTVTTDNKYSANASTAIGSGLETKNRSYLQYNCQCREQSRGRSPLQDFAYRKTTDNRDVYRPQPGDNGSLTRPNSLLPSSSHKVIPTFNDRRSTNAGFGDKYSNEKDRQRVLRYDEIDARRGSNGYPRRDSPLRERRSSVEQPNYDLIERKYLAEKLQS